MFKKSLVLLFFMFSGCGWFMAGDGHPDQPSEPPPELEFVETTNEGEILVIFDKYNEVSTENQQIVCEDYRDVSKTIGPVNVEEQSVGFIYDTIERKHTITLDDRITDDYDLIHSDYIFVKTAELFVEKGVTMEFIEWIKAYPDNYNEPMVVWSPNPKNRRVSLQMDGKINLRDYIVGPVDNEYYFTIASKIRGKSPSADTKIGLDFTLMVLSNCE